MFNIAQVALEKTNSGFDKLYSYLVPQDMPVQAGCRVTVPFGAGNHRRMGIVLGVTQAETADKLKSIHSLVDDYPILAAEQMGLLYYLREHTFCCYYDAVKVMVPAGMGMNLGERYRCSKDVELDRDSLSDKEQKLLERLSRKKAGVRGVDLEKELGVDANSSTLKKLVELGHIIRVYDDRRKIADAKLTMVRLAPRGAEEPPLLLRANRREVLDFLTECETASVKEVCYYCGVGRTTVENMYRDGILEVYEQDVLRNPYENIAEPIREEIHLSEQQQRAYEQILTEPRKPTLLHGVTGSGKTQVFLKLIDRTLKSGRGVIVMVPEISLTPQTIESFHRRYGSRTAVLHSSLSMSQRKDEWRRIRSGEADIVVGTRSAVFAPMDNIGLIVIDEEQERSYKSDSNPRYHTRDVAEYRCKYHNAKLLLCSATPSVESYYKARRGGYQLVTMPNRYAGELPDVYIVDMSSQPKCAGSSVISEALAAELQHNLFAGEQSILLLNRRGYNTIARCSSCAEVLSCPNCSVALTHHASNGQMMCHYCGHSQWIPFHCPTCGSRMMEFSGVGTQKVEEELQKMFPEARILRMDMDTTMSRHAYEQGFGDFAKNKYDIMIGTQMVAKGLNFPNVTLVGVLSADMSLYSDDFRSHEKTFSLLTQVVGRSGRYDLPGRAYIQTHQPDNPIFQLASEQDYEKFYAEEIEFRRIHLYPPFCNIVSVCFASGSKTTSYGAAVLFSRNFIELAKKQPDLPIRLLNPTPARIHKVAGKYRHLLLIKCRDSEEMRSLLRATMEKYYSARSRNEVTPVIDMYYDNMI